MKIGDILIYDKAHERTACVVIEIERNGNGERLHMTHSQRLPDRVCVDAAYAWNCHNPRWQAVVYVERFWLLKKFLRPMLPTEQQEIEILERSAFLGA